MAEPYDSWHKQQTKRGERRCRDHGCIPSSRHGQGPRWIARWRDDGGRQLSAGYDDFEQARKHLRDVEIARLNEQRPDLDRPGPTFAQASASWLAGRKSKSSRTYTQYEARVRNHLDNFMGNLQLGEIKPSTIIDWISGRREAGLDDTTIGLALSHLSSILEQCVDDELIGRNPCRAKSVRDMKPRHSKKPARNVPLTAAQLNAVRDNLPARYKAIADVGRALGLRQGEIFGLSPDDIDPANKEVRIRRQIAHDGNKLVYAALKAGQPIQDSERRVPVPDELLSRLTAHTADFPPADVTLPWESADGSPRTVALYFTTREGKALNSNYINWIWKAALEAAGIITTLNDKPAGRGRLWEPRRPRMMHAIRHLYASERIEAGMSIHTLADRLGHADPAYTLRNYVHQHLTDHEAERRLVDQALRGTPPSPYTASMCDGCATHQPERCSAAGQS